MRGLSNELAAFLHSLPDDIWRDADRYLSGCDKWNLADVVAHLIYGALGDTIIARRALRGDLSPPMSYRPMSGADNIAVDLAANQVRVVLQAELTPDLLQIKYPIIIAAFTPGEASRSMAHE